MYHPTTRLLTILELLQTHPHLSGEALARRLEVEPRTVRRYILMLQEMGMPVEAVRGPGGGYRLRSGFKLPPLLFTEEEATAVVLGLLGMPLLEIDSSAVPIEGALAKVYRVLPERGRERLQAMASSMVLSPHRRDRRPDASLLVAISEAVSAHQRITIEYSSYHNEFTRRTVEPYGLIGWRGYWYVVGYCCLRQGYRLFRLDRVRDVQFLPETFIPAEDFDCQDYVRRLASVPNRWSIEVEFHTELYILEREIPSSFGRLRVTPTGVLFQTHHDDLTTMAHYLIGLKLPFVVLNPPELRAAMLDLAQSLIRIATTEPNSSPS